MSYWHRRQPFSADRSHSWIEHWDYNVPGSMARSFPVTIRAGKPLDVLGLKGLDLEEVKTYAAYLAETAKCLYSGPAETWRVIECPACWAPLQHAKTAISVFSVDYLRCEVCGHVCVGNRPDASALDRLFAESEVHSSTYVDRRAIDIRMRQIIAPKLEWCLESYLAHAGREPQSLLDVGAGGGHFVSGALRRGLRSSGYEKSHASRTFAREAFGVELLDGNFLEDCAEVSDLITFWGLLEYVEQPRRFLAAAKKRLRPDGMLVVEVPRVDALGTAVQGMNGATIARHMDPTTHVNGFSDASLCTALVEEGFRPVAAWYFGMDAYEFCMQAALRSNDPTLFNILADFIPVLQTALDRGRQCDDIIVAAVPAG